MDKTVKMPAGMHKLLVEQHQSGTLTIYDISTHANYENSYI